MTHNWTYKKLTDICGIQYGYPFDSKCFTEDNSYPQLIRIRDVVRGYSETYYKGSIPEEYYVKAGEYLIGMDGEFNIAPWRSADALLNQRVCKVFSTDSETDERFVYYSLIKILKQIEDETPSVTVKHLSAKRLNQIEFPIPSLSEQESIVAELDAINHLIDLHEQQLREYDRLAQSLFYSTFGDPTTNHKGWKVKKLSYVVSEECKMSYGIVQPGDDIEDGVPVVRPIDFKDSEYIQRKGLKKTLPSISDSYKRTILRGDEILICVRGTTGTMGLATPELKGCNVTRGIVPLYFRNEMNKWFMYKYLKSNFAQNIIAENTYGATLKQINISALRSIPIMCPPLSLQQSFAAQIEAIEQQKALIRRSLEHTRTLLAARMQYYFE